MKLFPKKNDKNGFVELLPLSGREMEPNISRSPGRSSLAVVAGRSSRLFEKRQHTARPSGEDAPKRGLRNYLAAVTTRKQNVPQVNGNEESMETASTASMASAASVFNHGMIRPVLITVAGSDSPVIVKAASVPPQLEQYSPDILNEEDEELQYSRSRLFEFDSDSSSSLVDNLTFDDYNTFSESTTAGSLAGTSTIGASTTNSSFLGGSSVYSISVLEGATTRGSSMYESIDDGATTTSSVDGDKTGCQGPSGTPKTIKDMAMGMSHIFGELIQCGQIVVATAESAVLSPPPKTGKNVTTPSSNA